MKSRLTTAPLFFDASGAAHLLAGTSSGHGALLRVFEQAGSVPKQLLYSADDSQTVLDGLRQSLAEATMGLRLYLAGPETFLAKAMQIAEEFGFSRDEVYREATDLQHRRVFCLHCRHYNESATPPLHKCGGCGRMLEVRDHFSRRLASYFGVAPSP
jgi:dimethylamine monooxygenase subunit C